jgi:hypothetical protein
MGYNKFRWWATGKRKKPLSDRAPLFDKIKNGDYDYSFMFGEADKMKLTAKQAYQQTYDNYGGTDEKNRVESALEASRMKRLKAIKLQLEAHKDEQKILYKLQKDFKEVFKLDIFDEAVDNCGGDLISLYQYYKNYARSKDSVL